MRRSDPIDFKDFQIRKLAEELPKNELIINISRLAFFNFLNRFLNRGGNQNETKRTIKF